MHRLRHYALNVVYACLLLGLAPYLLWRSWRTGRYRRGWGAKLLGNAPATPADRPLGPVVWLHAVSVGEVNLLGTLIDRLERELPGCRCVISTTTDTGFEVASRRYAPRDVFYCPLDFSWAVARALRRVRPDVLLLAELELWPNLVDLASRHGARVMVANARLSESSARGYGRVAPVIRRLLSRVDCVCAQTTEYAERFRSLGAPRVLVTGSVKFDGACGERNNPQTRALCEWAGLRPWSDVERELVFVAGSTQAPEEQLAVEAYLRLRAEHPRLRLVLAPRHPERGDEVASLLRRNGVAFARRSESVRVVAGDDASDSDSNRLPHDAAVCLIDVVGELGAWWGRADIAYVGGSMGSRGGQNMIEPAAYGCPVSFGPKTRNFRDVVAMMKAANACCVVEHGAELTRFVQRCLEQPAWAESLGKRARQLVHSQQGAADRTVEQLIALLGPERSDDGPQRLASEAEPSALPTEHAA